MRLRGYVRVTNKSGEDYQDAQTRLIVGKVHLLDQIAELARRKYPYDRPGKPTTQWSFNIDGPTVLDRFGILTGDGLADVFFDARARVKEIKKEGLSEYFLYTIEGTETIPDGWGKRLPSFEVDDIPVESLYKYDQQRWGDAAVRFVSFVNDAEHKLGQTPIPNGNIKIYRQVDRQEHRSYVGGSNIKYIPVNEKVQLNLGPARLVSVEPVLMDFRTENFVFDRKGRIDGFKEVRTWKIEIANTSKLPVQIEITRGFKTPYWKLTVSEDQVTYKKHDATHARFTLQVDPRTKRIFTYTIRTYHGKRQEAFTW